MAGHGKQCYVKSRCYSLALCRVAWCLVVKKRARIEAFTLEIALKIIALGVGVLKDPWNWFDTFLAARRDVPLPLPHQVACWYIDTLGQDLLPVNTTLLRLLRLMRLLRLLRRQFTVSEPWFCRLVRLIKTFAPRKSHAWQLWGGGLPR